MVYAVSRQESAFAPEVQSSAGARGLMQLMPDTARRTAKRLGLEFDLGRLLDPAYNTKLGAAHLGELMEDWKGSPILMLSSYNARVGATFPSGLRPTAIRARPLWTLSIGWNASRSPKPATTSSA